MTVPAVFLDREPPCLRPPENPAVPGQGRPPIARSAPRRLDDFCHQAQIQGHERTLVEQEWLGVEVSRWTELAAVSADPDGGRVRRTRRKSMSEM